MWSIEFTKTVVGCFTMMDITISSEKKFFCFERRQKKNKKLEGGSQPINSNAGTQVQKYFTNINTSCKDMEQMPRRVLVVSQETQPNLFSTPVLFC